VQWALLPAAAAAAAAAAVGDGGAAAGVAVTCSRSRSRSPATHNCQNTTTHALSLPWLLRLLRCVHAPPCTCSWQHSRMVGRACPAADGGGCAPTWDQRAPASSPFTWGGAHGIRWATPCWHRLMALVLVINPCSADMHAAQVMCAAAHETASPYRHSGTPGSHTTTQVGLHWSWWPMNAAR
jgi:hypothetical protein